MPSWIRRGLLLVLLLLVAVSIAAWYINSRLITRLDIHGETVFLLAPGTSYSAMLNQLEQQGLIKQPAPLKFYGRLFPEVTQIRAGEYLFHEGVTVADALEKMRLGDVVRHQLTLVEGWTFKQVLKYLTEQEYLTPETLPADDSLWTLLGVESPLASNPEGLFFPDTYDYHRGDSVSSILQRAYRKLVQVVDEEWQNRAAELPYESPYQALIMASIIEKETGVARERGTIAGVFTRRLTKGMRLQTDPTVIYGLGEGYAGNLRLSHLKDPANVYNTYRHQGLPPTPIALAGREAIHAALHPEPGTAIFFVAKGDGTHHFSTTLKEHEAAVQQYQIRKRRSDYRSAPPISNSK